MKQKISKLFLLLLTMSVLTSSREYGSISRINKSLNEAHACSQGLNDYAVNIKCKKMPVVQEKTEEAIPTPVADNEVPLSPISRFILLQ